MRRFCCTLVVFTVCIGAVVGCRRVDGVQRKPTPNHSEEDMLPGRRDDETSLHARPKERRTLVWLGNVRTMEAELKVKGGDPKAYWKKVAADQKAREENKEAAEDVGKRKEAAEKANREDEFENFGKACKEYVTARPAKEWTEENALKWFRRELKFYPKKWLDSVEGEIKIERYWYHDFIAQKTATFVPFVDFKDNFEPKINYIMCTTDSTAGGGGGMMMGGGGGGGGGSGPNVIYHDLSPGTATGIKDRVNIQEMRILYVNYMRYQFTLNPKKGEQPTYDGYMKYLREHAPGQLLQDIDDKVIYIHKPADGILGTGNLACRTEPAYLTISGSSPVPRMTGNPFPGVKVPPPTKKNAKEDQPGMPGMPGMPPG
jgi:hypothetical protein